MRLVKKKKERTPEQIRMRFKGSLILLGVMLAVILVYRVTTPKPGPTQDEIIQTKMDALLGEDFAQMLDSMGLTLVSSRPATPVKDILTPTYEIENQIQTKEMELSMSGIMKEITQEDYMRMKTEIDKLKRERDSIIDNLPVRMSRVLFLQDATGKRYTAVQNTDTLFTESVVSTPMEMEPIEDMNENFKEIINEE